MRSRRMATPSGVPAPSISRSSPDAEDAYQETFLKYALAEDARFNDEEHRKAWLIRVATNVCKDMLKAASPPMRARSTQDALDDEPGRRATPASQPASFASDVADALRALSDPPRTPVYLSLYEGYSAPEIAKMLGAPVNTVYSWIARGKKQLQGAVMSDWEERLRAAFDAMDVPEGLNGRTLEAIERMRAQEQGREPSVAEGRGNQASDPARTQEPAQGGAHCRGPAFARRAPSARESASQAEGASPRGAGLSVRAGAGTLQDAASSVRAGAGTAPDPASQAAPARRAKAAFGHAVQDGGGVAAAPACRAKAAFWKRAALAAAACLALVLVGVGGYRWYAEPTALVSVDVNPSVELELNRFDTVMAARGVNADGQALLESVPVAGKTYAEAMDALASSEAFSRYVSDDSYVEITVVCDDAEQARTLEEASGACLASLPCEGACQAAGRGEWQAAREAGMGVGRYRAALEADGVRPERHVGGMRPHEHARAAQPHRRLRRILRKRGRGRIFAGQGRRWWRARRAGRRGGRRRRLCWRRQRGGTRCRDGFGRCFWQRFGPGRVGRQNGFDRLLPCRWRRAGAAPPRLRRGSRT